MTENSKNISVSFMHAGQLLLCESKGEQLHRCRKKSADELVLSSSSFLLPFSPGH